MVMKEHPAQLVCFNGAQREMICQALTQKALQINTFTFMFISECMFSLLCALFFILGISRQHNAGYSSSQSSAYAAFTVCLLLMTQLCCLSQRFRPSVCPDELCGDHGERQRRHQEVWGVVQWQRGGLYHPGMSSTQKYTQQILDKSRRMYRDLCEIT